MKYNLIINENYARYVFKMIELKENNKNRMKVLVVNKDGKPLMPCSPKKARLLLKSKKAYILNYQPFTIKLKYQAYSYTQPITLGMDIGSRYIGISCSTEKDEVLSMEVELRNDISKLLLSRKQARRTRRQHKTRYRKPRFKNRTRKKGWIPPSIQSKIDTHINIVRFLIKYLPISKAILEVASFDIQKLINPEINGVDYQNGEQKGFFNVREFVLFRDNHTCQCCKGKSKDKKLNIHHIKHRSKGGSNKQDNLITLCETCHKLLHKGLITLKGKPSESYKDSVFMNIAKDRIVEGVEKLLPVEITYGYITKSNRIQQGLRKTHYNDAYCITNNFNATKLGIVYKFKKIRRHNRQLYKDNIEKGGYKKPNQCPYITRGFRRYDMVEYKNKLYFINSLRNTGCFEIHNLQGVKISKTPAKLKLIKKRGEFVTDIIHLYN